jgi:SAM-dependent methyltransferase
MQEHIYEHLYQVEDRHWWYIAKRLLVEAMLQRFLRPSDTDDGNCLPRPRVADIGCGCGAMLQQLRDHYDVVGVDPSPQAREFCARRGIEVAIGSLPNGLTLARSSFDAVLLLDVVEHLDDDDASVRASAQLLKPGGIMVSTSPAYQWLWSDWDVQHHHRRRYTLEQFRALFTRAGLRIELSSYANTALFPLAATARLAGRFFGRRGAGEMRVPPAPVNAVLRTLFASERGVLGRLQLPFGLSVIVVARRGESGC